MARPTKFKEKYINDLVEFFDIEPYKQIVTEETTESFKDGGVKKESKKYRMMPNKMPTLYRFSKKIKVDYSTVYRWAEKGDEEGLQNAIDVAIQKGETEKEDVILMQQLQRFCKAYKEAKELQKEFLINVGMAGAAPAPFAIFTAKNVTDMRDKQETDITSKGERIVVVPNELIKKNDNANTRTEQNS